MSGLQHFTGDKSSFTFVCSCTEKLADGQLSQPYKEGKQKQKKWRRNTDVMECMKV